MDKQKLNTKDLINIGIFTVLYFVMFFISGMLGYIPIFAVLLPLVLGILCGIPFTLFLTKTGKFGAVTIMGFLVSLLCFLVGQSWISIIFGVVFGFLADLIFKAGNYKSWKHTVLGYCVFTEWVIGSMLPMWIMRDAFFETYRTKGGGTEEYISALMNLTSNYMIPVVVLLGIVGGVLGAYLGRAVLKKHFKKAGIA
ncbi:MAG: MptD family putative ECF transporter S component [Lachnospiraceae bacterium]